MAKVGKVIVITGASSGIGAALAQQLARAGHSLVLAARRQAELENVARQCAPNARAVVTDVTRRSEVERLRDEAIRAFGHIDVWVNNAGRGIGRQVMDLTDDDVDQMMLVNLKSALYGMQAVVPHFQQRGQGHLINVSSFLGRVPAASFRSVYSASKAALNSLTANLRMDLAAKFPGIHVSVVMPGIVTTEFHKNALYGTPQLASGPGMNGQTPDEAASAIVKLIDSPVAEIFTNPAQAEVAKRYYQDVAAGEAAMRSRG